MHYAAIFRTLCRPTHQDPAHHRQDGSHYWKGASQGIEKILENSGLFEVDMLITPDFGEDINRFEPSFKGYNLVIINYGGATWKESVRKAFEKYVSDGGGVVVLHSSIIPWKTGLPTTR